MAPPTTPNTPADGNNPIPFKTATQTPTPAMPPAPTPNETRVRKIHTGNNQQHMPELPPQLGRAFTQRQDYRQEAHEKIARKKHRNNDDPEKKPNDSQHENNKVKIEYDGWGLPFIYHDLDTYNIPCTCEEPTSDRLTTMDVHWAMSKDNKLPLGSFFKIVENAFGDGNYFEDLCMNHRDFFVNLLKVDLHADADVEDVVAELIVPKLAALKLEHLGTPPSSPFVNDSQAAALGTLPTPGGYPKITYQFAPTANFTEWTTRNYTTYKSEMAWLFNDPHVKKVIREEERYLRHHAAGTLHVPTCAMGTYTLIQQAIQEDPGLYRRAVQLKARGVVAMMSYPLPPLLVQGTRRTWVETDPIASAATGMEQGAIDVYVPASDCTTSLFLATLSHQASVGLVAQTLLTSETADVQKVGDRLEISNLYPSADDLDHLRLGDEEALTPHEPCWVAHQLEQGDVLFVPSTTIMSTGALRPDDELDMNEKPRLIYRNRLVPIYEEQRTDKLARNNMGRYIVGQSMSTATLTTLHKELLRTSTQGSNHAHNAWNPAMALPHHRGVSQMLTGYISHNHDDAIEDLRLLFSDHAAASMRTIRPHTIRKILTAHVKFVVKEACAYKADSYFIRKYTKTTNPGDYLEATIRSLPLNMPGSRDFDLDLDCTAKDIYLPNADLPTLNVPYVSRAWQNLSQWLNNHAKSIQKKNQDQPNAKRHADKKT